MYMNRQLINQLRVGYFQPKIRMGGLTYLPSLRGVCALNTLNNHVNVTSNYAFTPAVSPIFRVGVITNQSGGFRPQNASYNVPEKLSELTNTYSGCFYDYKRVGEHKFQHIYFIPQDSTEMRKFGVYNSVLGCPRTTYPSDRLYMSIDPYNNGHSNSVSLFY